MNKIKRISFFTSVFFLLISPLMAQEPPVLFEEPLSPRIANYDIDVRLDPDTRILTGQEILTWHNKTQHSATELRFHLYLNAFRNSRSTFMKRTGGVHRGNKIDKDGWGFIDVTRFAIKDGEDLTGAMEFIQPDDNNEDDKTVFRVPLPRPVPPGGTIRLAIDFTAKLPEPPFARTGAKKEYFFVGQWFPKIGVLMPDGTWNCHQFHANSEFFADFGVYNVRMTVPEENIVGATGIEVSVRKNGDGTATHFYHAEDVHDFAWTTSPEFVEFTGQAQDVSIRVLMQPDHAYQGERHLEAAKTAVEYFQNWYGDYPFPNLTVVDPRRGASGSGGMEYPTLITAGTAYGLPEGLRAVEMVIIHEFGHNFWYHLLASNEFEESWLDEGINTYTEIQIMNDAYGDQGNMVDLLGVKINDIELHRMQYVLNADIDPMLRKAWEYYDSRSYGVNSYSKPGVVLTTLQNYLGKEKMQEIMREYVRRWRFKHPTTKDFIAVANEVAGQDLNWFFDQAVYSNKVLDYSVDRIFSVPEREPSGFDFDMSTSGQDSISTDGSGMPDSVSASPAEDSSEADEEKIYLSGVNLRRLGDFIFPVELRVEFSDGEVITEHWDGKELWKKFRYRRAAKLVSATIDPENKVVLDVNYTNNSKARKIRAAAVSKLSFRLMFWMQALLDQPSLLNAITRLGSIF